MHRIAFLINPIAGLGGKVGLKGTDNKVEIAKKLGAKEIAGENAIKFLHHLNKENIFFLTCSGKMGENALKKAKIKNYEVVYFAKEKTTAEDTKNACKKFLNTELVVFCGGDGTARDVLSIIDKKIPIVGIPSGVKMYSGVFGFTPIDSAELVNVFFEKKLQLRDAEIMDIDEEKYRKDELEVKLFGYCLTPYSSLIQSGKEFYESIEEEEAKKGIAEYVIEMMEKDVYYILCPGTTTEKICSLLNLEKTLLGIDIIKNKKLIAKDVNEKQILKLLRNGKKSNAKDIKKGKTISKKSKTMIIVSPLGKQGFVFGRGNQQISAKIIKEVGIENILIISTPYKLTQTQILRVDVGDEKLNEKMRGYAKVISGYHRMNVVKVE